MTPLRLRIDVCTRRGLSEGVPRLLALLRDLRIRATFLVTMGPDASGLALLRLLRPSFAWKMLRSRAVASYGWRAAFQGTLLPAPAVGSGSPGLIRRVLGEGHDAGPHGWDHRRWQDGLPGFPRRRLEDEFGRMMDAWRSAASAAPAGFGAPAWMATPDLLDLEAAAGLRYAADSRGPAPFLPTMGGREFPVPQLPVSLPTLDEILTWVRRDGVVADLRARAAEQPEYCCYAAHAEMEGGPFLAEFRSFLEGLDRPVEPLSTLPLAGLPRAVLAPGRVRGRTTDVSLRAGA